MSSSSVITNLFTSWRLCLGVALGSAKSENGTFLLLELNTKYWPWNWGLANDSEGCSAVYVSLTMLTVTGISKTVLLLPSVLLLPIKKWV